MSLSGKKVAKGAKRERKGRTDGEKDDEMRHAAQARYRHCARQEKKPIRHTGHTT